MFDSLVDLFSAYPYLGVTLMFLICGCGLPLPEEIVLVAAGYTCFKGLADVKTMMLVCVGAILLGDVIPFALGRWLGLPLLRLKPVRMIITTERLARFHRWFRRRGTLVIFISRFIAGIRVVAYFTAGTMKTSWSRFILIDLCGIMLLVPPLVFVGYRFGGTIDDAIAAVKTAERGILWSAAVGAVGLGLWYWLRRRRRRKALVGTLKETFVEPRSPVRKSDASGPVAAPEAKSENPADAPDRSRTNDAPE